MAMSNSVVPTPEDSTTETSANTITISNPMEMVKPHQDYSSYLAYPVQPQAFSQSFLQLALYPITLKVYFSF